MRVGEKVVCIDAKFPLGIDKFYVALPVEGQVYVIRDMIDGGTWSGEPEIAVYLIGLNNPKSDKPPYFERGFSIKRFRPLDEVQGRATAEESKTEKTLVPLEGVTHSQGGGGQDRSLRTPAHSATILRPEQVE